MDIFTSAKVMAVHKAIQQNNAQDTKGLLANCYE